MSDHQPNQTQVLEQIVRSERFDQETRSLIFANRAYLFSEAARRHVKFILGKHNVNVTELVRILLWQDLLDRCNEEDVNNVANDSPYMFEGASALSVLLSAESWDSSLVILRRESDRLLSGPASRILEQLQEYFLERDGTVPADVARCREILRQCTRYGVEEVTSTEACPNEALAVLFQFLDAPSWHEARQIVVQQSEVLLMKSTLWMLDSLIESTQQEGERSFLQGNRELLQDCRERGIDEAFGEVLVTQNQTMGTILGAAEAEARFHQTGDVEALNEAISILAVLLEGDLWDDSNVSVRSIAENQIVGCLMARFQTMRDEGDLQWALSLSEQLFAKTDRANDDYAIFALNRATALLISYERQGNIEDLDGAIAIFEEVLNEVASEVVRHASDFVNLAKALGLRFDRNGTVEVLHKAIDLLRMLESHLDADTEILPHVWQTLVSLLRRRYLANYSANDLGEAIKLQERLELVSGSSRGPSAILDGLAHECRQRFEATGNQADLDRAINLLEQALAQSNESSVSYPAVVNNLGATYSLRYEITNNALDLARSIELLERAHEHLPKGHEDHYYYGVNLGLSILHRHNVSGVAADLDRSLKLFEDAVEHTPALSPRLPNYLNTYASGLSDRFARYGNLEDLDRALRLWQDAVTVSQKGSSEWCGILGNLCLGLQARYLKTGSKDDVERALFYCEQLVQFTPLESSTLDSHLELMEQLVREHFLLDRNLGRINEALATWKSVVSKISYVSR